MNCNSWRRSALAGALLCLLAVLGTTPIVAQIITGSIGGNVTDATGAAIANAKVTITSPNLIGGARTINSDASGAYRFLELPPGTYTVRFEKEGFKAFSEQNIVINTGVQVAANAKLDLGDVTQQVTVEAAVATIDTEHVTSQTVANQAVMEDIPNGRSPWAIANSAPAITTSAFDVGGSSGMQQASLTAHGSTTADQKFMIDGISVNWAGGAGGSTLLYYDMGMFQEVNYIVGAAPADVSQGGVYINMITGDGGNQFHGKVFASGASQGMQSNNISPELRTQLLNNLTTTTKALIPNLNAVIPGTPITEVYDYNGQLGGPIIKDKLWFFTSWRQWAANNIVAGAFNHNGTQALNPNQIDNEMGKFSYQATPKNRFSLMYFRNQKNRYDRRNQGNFGDNVTTVLQNQPGYEWDFKWTYVPTNRWVIDAGFALTAGKTPYRYQNAAPANAISVYDTLTTEVFNIAQYTYLNPVYRGALDASASYFNSTWGGTHNIKFGYQDYKDGFKQRYVANGDLQGVLNNGVPAQAYL
ncbi:MAG TPA: TonB-dependent receptor, partial [Bryobacteraceae bacterium]|nr:TonB-dependent receptor [Bryobacteraceae bacterium]